MVLRRTVAHFLLLLSLVSGTLYVWNFNPRTPSPASQVSLHTRSRPHLQRNSSAPLLPCAIPKVTGTFGTVNLSQVNMSVTDIMLRHDDVTSGGAYRPRDCKAQHSVAVIVPYRERRAQLYPFLNHLHAHLKGQRLRYRIYISEQIYPYDVFNKGAMMNIGFEEARKDRQWDCYIFHDVDMLPEHPLNPYRCEQNPVHLGYIISKYKYKPLYGAIFGGVIALRETHFRKANGFSNGYWGWGGEDDDMRIRITNLAGFRRIVRPPRDISRYTAMRHAPIASSNRRNAYSVRARSIHWQGALTYRADGLSSLRYRLLRRQAEPLYTWLLSALDRKELEAARDQLKGTGFTLSGRLLHLQPAVTRDKAGEIQKTRNEKQAKDKRNLYLAREGLIRPGTAAAAGLSKLDLQKRLKLEQVKRVKLKEPTMFVSTTRLCVHNILPAVDEAVIRAIFLEAAGSKRAAITECRIMRDVTKLNKKGVGQSRGYGFVNFTEHAHALAALREVNNNPKYFGEQRRPIVEFSVENLIKLQMKQRRLQRHQAKQKLKGDGATSAPPVKDFVNQLRKPTGLAPEEKAKLPKGLPTHWGAKIRHKRRDTKQQKKKQGSAAASKNSVSGKQNQQKQPGEKQRAKKRRGGHESADRFDRLVSQYKAKIQSVDAAERKKWFS